MSSQVARNTERKHAIIIPYTTMSFPRAILDNLELPEKRLPLVSWSQSILYPSQDLGFSQRLSTLCVQVRHVWRITKTQLWKVKVDSVNLRYMERYKDIISRFIWQNHVITGCKKQWKKTCHNHTLYYHDCFRAILDDLELPIERDHHWLVGHTVNMLPKPAPGFQSKTIHIVCSGQTFEASQKPNHEWYWECPQTKTNL